MKFLVTLVFLALTGCSFMLGRRRFAKEAEAFGDVPQPWVQLAYQTAFIVIAFTGFTLLTRLWLPMLLAVMLGVMLVGQVVYMLAGAVAGFWLEETRRKVAILNVSRTFESTLAPSIEGRVPVLLVLFLVIVFVALGVSVVGSLWVYWRYPSGLAGTNARIALFQFTLPNFFAQLMIMATLWPSVASEYIDDDVRNASLATGFSAVAGLTVYIFLPVWLFRGEWRETAAVVPLWLLMSAPFLVFLLIYAVPFFVGMYLHRHQGKKMLEWHKTWLQELLAANKLPPGDLRNQRLDDARESIDREIARCVKRCPLLKVFHFLATGHLEVHAGAARHQMLPAQAGVMTSVAGSATIVEVDSTEVADRLEDLTRKVDRSTARVVTVLWENRRDLVTWDLRLSHAEKLVQIRPLAILAGSADIKETVQIELKDVQDRLKRQPAHRNVLAAAIVSVVTAVVPWLFKTWEPAVVAALNQIIGQ